MGIYLDYNASTPLHPLVREKIVEWSDLFGNPSSYNQAGRTPRMHIEQARRNILELLGGTGNDLFFGSSASEMNSWVIASAYYRARGKNPNQPPRIAVSAIEHPSIISAVEFWSKQGAEIEFLPVSSTGKLDLEFAKSRINSDVDLVCVMLANNEIGTIQPIAEIAEICSANKVHLHVDAVQAVTKIPVDFNALNVTSITIGGHKVYAREDAAYSS